MSKVNKDTTSGRWASSEPNEQNVPREITASITVRSGMVFWMLWAATQATVRDPYVHAMNLFRAAQALYPIAQEYDRRLITEHVLPLVVLMNKEMRDTATKYFFDRTEQLLRNAGTE